jgi:hypothetical protein
VPVTEDENGNKIPVVGVVGLSQKLEQVFVTELPEVGEEHKTYLVLDESLGGDIATYNQWIWVDNAWAKVSADMMVPVAPKHIELTGTLVEGYKNAGQVYLNPFTWDYSPDSDHSIPFHFSGAHPNSGNGFLHFEEPGLYEIALINRISSNTTAYPEEREIKWVVSGYVSESPTVANTGIVSDGLPSTAKNAAIPKRLFFNFDAKDVDHCIVISGEYDKATYGDVTNTITVQIRITQLAVLNPYLIANKGALVSGGAFQFDEEGNCYTENYSTDEVRAGTWIDGKPIYKKTWYRGNMAFADSNAVLFLSFPEDTPWMERIVNHEMTFARTLGVGVDDAIAGTTNLKLLYARAFNSVTGWGIYTALHAASTEADRWLTLYYTKTTDTV